MTNAELVKQVKAFAPATGAEVERRLERLAKCEAALQRILRCEMAKKCPQCYEAARAALEVTK